MAANRGTVTAGTVTGTEYGADVNDEIVALWKQVTGKLSSVSGTNTITAVVVPTLAAYVDGQRFAFIPAVNSTSTVTINIDSLGAKSIKHQDGSALASGDLLTTTIYEVMYDGTNFRLMVAPPSLLVNVEVAIIRHHQTDGTDGGGATSGASVVYPLTEIVVNGITGLSLSSNKITIPAGTFVVDAVVQLRNTGTSKLLLYDATGTAYFADFVGPQIEAGSVSGEAHLFAVIVLSGATDVELHYDVEANQTTDGLGRAHGGLSDDEEYGAIKITRISA